MSDDINTVLDRHFPSEMKIDKRSRADLGIDDLARIRDGLRPKLPDGAQIDLMIFLNTIALTVTHERETYKRSCMVVRT